MERNDLQLSMRVWAEVEQYDCNEAGYGIWRDVERICKVVDIDDNEVGGNTIEVEYKYTDGTGHNRTEYQRVDIDDVREVRNVYELSEEECKKLAQEVGRGSIYLADYYNSLGVDPDSVYACSESYYDELYNQYGDNSNEHDTTEEFARYLWEEC